MNSTIGDDATVVEVARRIDESPTIVCDVSPPRGPSPDLLRDAALLDAEFLYTAYNPGQSVRVNSVATAATLDRRFGVRGIFSLATRDMNRIAIQSLLLGASMLDLRNVVVLKGDPLRPRDEGIVNEVNDYTSTTLVRDISQMNRGRDFRGLQLQEQTAFCIGATADLGRGLAAEIALTVRKIRAGAEFFLCQPQFDSDLFREFDESVDHQGRGDRRVLLFAGVQLLHPRGVDFGNVPEWVYQQIRGGRTGMDIAVEQATRLWEVGVRQFYVVPPILEGGRRDYEATQQLIGSLRKLR